jgi:hypothetical protein
MAGAPGAISNVKAAAAASQSVANRAPPGRSAALNRIALASFRPFIGHF